MKFFMMFVTVFGVASCGTEIKGLGNDAGNDAGFDLARCVSNEFAPCADPRCCVLRACEGEGVCSGPGNDAGNDAGPEDAGNDAEPDGPVADGGPVLPDCDTDDDCSRRDGNACNGIEYCLRGECLPGAPVDCSDDIRCTRDACVSLDPSTSSCQHIPDDAHCGGLHCEADPDGAGPGVGRGCICFADADCPDDGLACNGKPECVANACRAGEIPLCADGNECTADSCVELEGGFGCTHFTIDIPRCEEPPCREGEVNFCVVPGCESPGFQTCVGGAFEPCHGPEICDGCDNNADGVADNGDPEIMECVRGVTIACETSCGSTGSARCNAACELGDCAPPTEVCNDSDDDCDGIVDNGFDCRIGETRDCSTRCGSTGTQTCSESCGWGACVPDSEVCNGRDDDCSGGPDDGFVCVLGTLRECFVRGCDGGVGVKECLEGCVFGPCHAVEGELCGNFRDDDCRPETPDSCPPPPPSEICNGLDDNGDRVPDNGFECVEGSTRECLTECRSLGSQPCTLCSWERDRCDPPMEECNGFDDNCDRRSDEGFACRRFSSASCTASCGSTGRQSCSSDCSWGACVPPLESCNGRDDDCDNVPDDGFSCAFGATRSCTSSCGTTGSQACGATCAWGACVPPAENCLNNADDDCDGVANDGCAERFGAELLRDLDFASRMVTRYVGGAPASAWEYMLNDARGGRCFIDPTGGPSGTPVAVCIGDNRSYSEFTLQFVQRITRSSLVAGVEHEFNARFMVTGIQQPVTFQIHRCGSPWDGSDDAGMVQQRSCLPGTWCSITRRFTARDPGQGDASDDRICATVHIGNLTLDDDNVSGDGDSDVVFYTQSWSLRPVFRGGM